MTIIIYIYSFRKISVRRSKIVSRSHEEKHKYLLLIGLAYNHIKLTFRFSADSFTVMSNKSLVVATKICEP